LLHATDQLPELCKRRLITGNQVAFNFYPSDAMLARVLATATCLSVCHIIVSKRTISSVSDSPTILVF